MIIMQSRMDKLLSIESWNKFLYILRLISVILPLRGYIHPDESFQSTEIMANDILNVKGVRTWEWNCSYPSRNLLFPVITAGIPYWILKNIRYYSDFNLSAELLVIAPRLVMLSCVHIIEKFLYHIYKMQNANEQQCELGLFLFRTSHVTLVFLTRTFSNTLETLLHILLLFLTIKMSKSEESKSVTKLFFTGFIVAVGLFIRPSFLAFAFYPLAHTAFSILVSCLSLKMVIFKITKFALFIALGFVIGSLVNIILDHYYFTSEDCPLWSITPLNLILYNTNINELTQHGIHPRFLHLAVNMILMFGPLYILYIYLCWNYMFSFFSRGVSKVNTCVTITSTKCLMMLSTVVPVLLLSMIPHQEPRYIIASIVPLVYFVTASISTTKLKIFYIPWLIFNLVGVSWYGFIHQGGVYPVLSHLNKELAKPNLNTTHHVLFWHTYMPPRHLLAINQRRDDVVIHDFGSKPFEHVLVEMRNIISNHACKSERNNVKIWFACSGLSPMMKNLMEKIPLELHKQFFPHLSMEHLPHSEKKDVTSVLSGLLSVNEFRQHLKDQFSLNLYVFSSTPDK